MNSNWFTLMSSSMYPALAFLKILILLILILLIILLLLLFISHTTSCIGGHVFLGHQAISHSLRCLGSFLRSLLFLGCSQAFRSKFKIPGVSILVTHIIKFLVTAPSAPITIGTTDTLLQFHIFCISTFKSW